ncbi:hypothetical protein WME79_18920 [Sorangium sp. So ce726]|uniref:hypothetical protein n=1 Tax=Sorangium sp. So ce726 TaxID=3133319 RepID=UPI003F60FFE8
MKSAKLIVLKALILAAPTLFLERNAHAQAMTDVIEGCLPQLQAGLLPADYDLHTLLGNDSSYTIPFGKSAQNCLGYTWINFKNSTNNKVMTPRYLLNVNSSAFDCEDTALSWGLYKRAWIVGNPPGQWFFVSGGFMRGKLVSGTCTYDPANPPWGVGETSVVVTPSTYGIIWRSEYRVAIKAYQDDDVSIGHPGTWCDSSAQCNQGVTVSFDAP